MSYQPKALGGITLQATRWAIRQGPQRLWNIQSVYNGACISGRCHAALSPGRLRGAMRSAAAQQDRAIGVRDTFATTLRHDVRRGAYVASVATRPATGVMDALIGTGRSPKPRGSAEDRLLRTADNLGMHFSNVGVLGGVLLGTALASAAVGAVLGAFYGVAKGITSIPMAWVVDRASPWSTVQRAVARGMVTGATSVVVADMAVFWFQVQGLRILTAALKLGAAAAGALVGVAIGLPHAVAAAYSVYALRRQNGGDSGTKGVRTPFVPTTASARPAPSRALRVVLA